MSRIYDDLLLEVADALGCPVADADDALRLVLGSQDDNVLDAIAVRTPASAVVERVRARLA